MTSEYGYVYLRARPSNSVRSASVRVRRYGLVRGMSFPPRGNHDTGPYESVGSDLRHCNYVSDHLASGSVSSSCILQCFAQIHCRRYPAVVTAADSGQKGPNQMMLWLTHRY